MNALMAEKSERSASPRGDGRIVYEDISKFYGEVLGVNQINLSVPPGITGLVGPNGSGKTTLMNLTAGLLRPTRGSISVLGVTPDHPEEMFRLVGYSTQYDAFPPGLTGFQFIESFLRVHGYGRVEAEELAWKAIERVNLVDAAGRKVAGYSKGMRQRIKLAQAISHRPSVLILDEPLNGLDPMARAEVIALFRELANAGLHVLVSSHILHEVDLISDQVVLIHGGYVVAEGDIGGVRDEMEEQHPAQVLIRCDQPSLLASRVFLNDHVVEARIHEDGKGLLVRTRDADRFYLLLNEVILETGLAVETVMPTDADVNAVYEYLISNGGKS
jgi:ABC-2 type transport system ATP-binding protein